MLHIIVLACNTYVYEGLQGRYYSFSSNLLLLLFPVFIISLLADEWFIHLFQQITAALSRILTPDLWHFLTLECGMLNVTLMIWSTRSFFKQWILLLRKVYSYLQVNLICFDYEVRGQHGKFNRIFFSDNRIRFPLDWLLEKMYQTIAISLMKWMTS